MACGNGLFVLASEAQPLSLTWFYTKLTVSFCSPTRAADYQALKIASRMKTCVTLVFINDPLCKYSGGIGF